MTPLKKALEEAGKAKDRVMQVLKVHFSPGVRLYWKRGQTLQRGEVVFVGHHRVKVRNDRTGKQYFIDAGQIVED